MKVGISAEKAEQRKPVANVIKLFQRVIYLLVKQALWQKSIGSHAYMLQLVG
jgi:hypothetical protein